jgi:hypothetical protein
MSRRPGNGFRASLIRGSTLAALERCWREKLRPHEDISATTLATVESKMRFPGFHFLILLAAAPALSGCTDVCGCPPLPPSAVVYGRVTQPTAEPVSGAVVRAYSAPAPDCYADGGGAGMDYGGIPTRTDGTFTMGLPGADPRDSICVFVFAQPAADVTSLTVSDTTLIRLSFRYGEPQDSARVDPVLRTP